MIGEQTRYGTDNPKELMEKFHDFGNDTLLKLRNLVISPEKRRKPRTWGIGEAAKMVGISIPTFMRHLKEEPNDLTGIAIEETKNGRKIKKYTLQLINTLRNKANTRYERPKGASPLVIAVSNLKGGVGKTETAVDLAKKMAIEGLRVLLLDQDAQGTATSISSGLIPDMEITYEGTITNCLINDPSLINKIIIHTHFDGLDIIPANLAIQDCDLRLPRENENNQHNVNSPFYRCSPFTRLTQTLNIVKNQYDVILIDCSPNVGMLTLNAIVACDGLIIPIPPNMNDYSSFIVYTSTLYSIFEKLSDKKLAYLRILLSKHNGSNEALQMENMMRAQFGEYILSNHMCETVEVSKAANEIGTIYDISKPRGSRDAYRRAIQHLDDVNMEIIDHFKAIWMRQSEENNNGS